MREGKVISAKWILHGKHETELPINCTHIPEILILFNAFKYQFVFSVYSLTIGVNLAFCQVFSADVAPCCMICI